MKFFKSLLATVALIAAVTISAQAQTTIDTVVVGGTNNVAAAATNTGYNISIPAPQSQNITLGATFQFHSGAPGVSNIVFVFDGSLDNANWSLSAHRFTAGATTNATTSITNIDVKACAYLRLASIENINAVVATNIILKSSVKPGI